jgi:hypothetical protein
MTLLDTPVRPAPDSSAESPKPAEGDGGGRFRRWWVNFSQPEALLTLVVVAACAVFTFVELQPSNIFANTTPTGGDMGAHVWLPWFVEHDLLPHFRITGWTMDWYAGFPALTYYFPLPMLAIVALDVVLPYNIAFKLVVVSGLIALPVVVWAFGRLSRMPFPGPACLAAATLPYLFSRTFTIYGGNIASNMAGEFSFSVSLAFAILLLGVTARGLETGRHRALASALLLCAGLSHILPTMFAVIGILVLTIMRWDRSRWRWTLPVFGVAGLLSCFWSLAFELRLPYATNMGYQKIVTYSTSLFPAGLQWLFVLAGIGAILSVARRRQIGTFLSIMTLICAVVFRLSPQGRLWNARVLPFWFLMLYLLAGLAFCEAGILIAEVRRGEGRATRASLIPIPVVTLLVSLVWVGFPLRELPFGHTTASGKYDWLGLTSSDNSFVPGWVTWNFTGYQGSDKPRKDEYFALVDQMRTLGKTAGCGRAMWEYQPELNDMGTPDALMLLPYWTNNCIDSMEGLYYESSATTPYHFLNAAELSVSPADPVRGLTYASSPGASPPGQTTTYFDEGISHLQMFGVKYYMAISPQTQQLASANPDLKLLAQTANYPVNYTSSDSSGTTGLQQRHWDIYEVLDSTLVTPLANQPVVMRGVSGGNLAWQNASVDWYDDPSRWSVYEAATGPKSWDRVATTDQTPPQTPLPAVNVSDVKVNQESMSFNVDRTGVPVLVNTSYFPNWQVSGGKGPYRVTPNLMVVIPTSKHVSLNYGYTPLDKIGYGLSFLGLIGLVVLWRQGPANYSGRRAQGRHVATGSPPPDPPGPGDGLADPWTQLSHELAGAPAGASPVCSDLAGFYRRMPGWYDNDTAGGLPPQTPPLEAGSVQALDPPNVEAPFEEPPVVEPPFAEPPFAEPPFAEPPVVVWPDVVWPDVVWPDAVSPDAATPDVEPVHFEMAPLDTDAPAPSVAEAPILFDGEAEALHDPATPALDDPGPAAVADPTTEGFLPEGTLPPGLLGGPGGHPR